MADALDLRIGMPIQYMLCSSTLSTNNVPILDPTYGMGIVFHAQDTNAITHLGFRYNLRTGTPPTYRVSLQGVDASTGEPNGTIKGGGSPASGTFTPPASTAWDGTFQWVTLTNSYTPTRGELLSLVIDYSSGTIDGSNYGRFDFSEAGSSYFTYGIPYSLDNYTGTWTKYQAQPIFGVRTASTRYGSIYTSLYTTLISTVGYRQAMKFNIPSTIASTYTIKGFTFVGLIAGAGGKNPIAGLWDAGGVLQNVTLDSDVIQGLSEHQVTVFFDETSLSTLSGGTNYYIGLQVADAASSGAGMYGYNVTDANDLLAQPLGTNAFLSNYNGSTWTDVTTARPAVELILGDITNSGGGGGGSLLVGSSMTGGFNQ